MKTNKENWGAELKLLEESKKSANNSKPNDEGKSTKANGGKIEGEDEEEVSTETVDRLSDDLENIDFIDHEDGDVEGQTAS